MKFFGREWEKGAGYNLLWHEKNYSSIIHFVNS